MKWLTTINAICPICRYQLPSKEERIDYEAEQTQAEQTQPEQTQAEQTQPSVTAYSSIMHMMRRVAEQQYNSEQNDMQSAILASLASQDSEP